MITEISLGVEHDVNSGFLVSRFPTIYLCNIFYPSESKPNFTRWKLLKNKEAIRIFKKMEVVSRIHLGHE
jgi:hypothetical protein